jgi:ATP-dependent DNA helicase RecG
VAVLDDSLAGVLGQKSADALGKALDLHTVGDLLRHYPRRYAERGELTDVAGLELGEHATVLAQVERASKRTMRNRRGTILEVRITDGQRPLTCTFFNQAWRERELLPGRRGLFAGKVNAFRGSLQLLNPEYQLLDEDSDESTVEDFAKKLTPIYPAAAGLPTWSIEKCVRQTLDVWDGTEDPLPDALRRERRLAGLEESLRRIHNPADRGDVARAEHRLKWDEALAVQLVLAQRRRSAGHRPARTR